MSVTATIVEGWQLADYDDGLVQERVSQNDVDNKVIKGWVNQAGNIVAVIRRHFVGLTAFSSERGTSVNSFSSLYIGGGGTISLSQPTWDGPNTGFLCTKDKIIITDFITGEGWEEQIWEYQTAFTEVPGSYREETVTEPAP